MVENYYSFFSTAINICGTPQDDCSKFATCENTGPGTYKCTCNQGYTGDGKTCEGEVFNVFDKCVANYKQLT